MTSRLVLLAGVLLLAACGAHSAGSSRDGQVPAEGPADGDYVADGLPAPFEAGDMLRVTLRDGNVLFQATCNTTSGLVDWDDGVLRTSSLGGTEIGCPGPGPEQDEWLVDFFTSSPAFQVDDTGVRIANDDDEIWLVPADEVDEDPDIEAALEGTDWRLIGIEQTDGDSIGMMGAPRRLNGNVAIRGHELTFGTGCNSGRGSVRVQGDRLTLRGVGITRMRCVGIRGEIESAQFPVLMAEQVGWSIDGRELRLTHRDTTVLYRA